ncbi:MAG: DUF3990 domain-containing protein [Fibromonadaceae bacterium]|jgi:hypothetical protein|nr:DUF3990 domain-containing protein [Fibromonadaceae bacterium]
MILFHGSNVEVSNIDLSKCGKYKDFGQGFYLTSLKQQAIEWAKKITKRLVIGKATLNMYEFDNELSNLNHKIFTEPNEEWATFIINNRNRDFTNHNDELSNHDNKYDFVHGLVANDDISAILETFLLGILPMSELSKALIYKKLNDQYSFHSVKALSHLKFLRSEIL